ncbi:MAG TPA: class I SAM-dependent methyltransferase [Thermoanaerobaculia bacterium]|nr:class I SAM-dependent methyltransferase [Thermoanaerobaculia bacterium]
MTTNAWQKIWNGRSAPDGPLDLAALIRLDGFDSGVGRIEADDWRIFSAALGRKLGLADGASVYEVGCGAGAFLYALRECHSLRVGGLDYAQTLIETARRMMPDGDFVLAEAAALPVAPAYDHVIAHGVFHYFNLDHAERVLDRMLAKARLTVAVLEVPDARTMQESEATRAAGLTQEEYDKKYSGLAHTHYERSWFEQQAAARGLTVEIFDGFMPNHVLNAFRFGAIIRKEA